MLAELKLKQLQELIGTSSKEELIWINGYLSGLISSGEAKSTALGVAEPKVNRITILYGTETGNSKKIATDFAGRAKKAGVSAKVISMDQYRVADFAKEEYLLAVVSTHGEGEPPAAAKKFYDHIHKNGFKVEKLKYGILALGDASYPLFCKAGEDIDRQLEKLGGNRLIPIQKCDVDYEEDAVNWINQVLKNIGENKAAVQPFMPAPYVVEKKPKAKKIYTGSILTNINLNDRGSNKETHHIEISAEETDYLPGDSIGIIPENNEQAVKAILSITGIEPTKSLPHKNTTATVYEMLKKQLSIVYLPERVVQKYAEMVKQDIPSGKMDLLDLLKIYPVESAHQFEEVISVLETITPRLYSISSSPEAHAGEVHITVAKDTYYINEEKKHGICSGLLCNLAPDTRIEFYFHRNNQFRLPAEERDVIMIGPGTGIAPFRSFLAHRDALGAGGRNWLFFGEQHFVSDFLYQTELQNWIETGVLTKLNVAFSRDQKKKVYVQDKMLMQGAELYEWITNGAYLYVCGSKEPMSVDVENTLLEIIEEHGNKTVEEAVQFIEQLKEEGRYLKDVY